MCKHSGALPSDLVCPYFCCGVAILLLWCGHTSAVVCHAFIVALAQILHVTCMYSIIIANMVCMKLLGIPMA